MEEKKIEKNLSACEESNACMAALVEKYNVVNFQHVLQREEHWNNWKNEGCPSFERVKAKDAPKPKAR